MNDSSTPAAATAPERPDRSLTGTYVAVLLVEVVVLLALWLLGNAFV